jgi:hypothetical protein
MNSFLACLCLLDAGDEYSGSFVGFLKEGRKTIFGNGSRFSQPFEPILGFLQLLQAALDLGDDFSIGSGSNTLSISNPPVSSLHPSTLSIIQHI